jgi:hypothetical protein
MAAIAAFLSEASRAFKAANLTLTLTSSARAARVESSCCTLAPILEERGAVTDAGLTTSLGILLLVDAIPNALFNASVTRSVGVSSIGSSEAVSMGIVGRFGEKRRTEGTSTSGFSLTKAGDDNDEASDDEASVNMDTVVDGSADSDVALLDATDGSEGPRLPKVLPSLSLHSSGFTPIIPESMPLIARLNMPLIDLVLSMDLGVPVAYRRP